MLIITVQVNAPEENTIGIKEDLVMHLERYGDARVISVEQKAQPRMEQMRIEETPVSKSVCRGCGAEIVWLKTAAGKRIPCDLHPVPYWERPGAAGKVVLPRSGKVVSCAFSGPRHELSGFGYVSHFSTCSRADVFRKMK